MECVSSTPEEERELESWIQDIYGVNQSTTEHRYLFGTQDCRQFVDDAFGQLAIIQDRSPPWQIRINFLPDWLRLFL
ncbi:MAG TPA: hypothetical protein VFU02_08475 [Polyangiaceae bacterium]|nr:hypothetical protein [Polyangiaceae bacterium]